MYKTLADMVVVAHFLFIVFVVLGGLWVIHWHKAAFIHLPAAIWGASIEFFGWVCPLTPLENRLRILAGENAYTRDFISQYLLPVIYPANITVTIQQILGLAVILINVIMYSIAFRKRSKYL